MSNDPSSTGDFGSRQFQKIQFGHKPHEEIRGDSVERMIKERLAKPAGMLKTFAILSLLIIFVIMIGYCGYLAFQRNTYVNAWNAEVLAAHRAERRLSTRPNQEMSKKEEQAIKSRTDWNKNYFTILIGFTVVMFFSIMCFSAFIAVTAHKMMNLKGYKQSMVACIMALIPFISPLIILGIPLGIWCLSVLKDPDVRRAFN